MRNRFSSHPCRSSKFVVGGCLCLFLHGVLCFDGDGKLHSGVSLLRSASLHCRSSFPFIDSKFRIMRGINGLGNEYPTSSKRLPRPAMGINIFIL